MERTHFLAKPNPTPKTQIELEGISPNIAQLVKPFITPNFDPRKELFWRRKVNLTRRACKLYLNNFNENFDIQTYFLSC